MAATAETSAVSLIPAYTSLLQLTVRNLALNSQLNSFPRPAHIEKYASLSDSNSLISSQISSSYLLMELEKLSNSILGEDEHAFRNFFSSFTKFQRNRKKIKKSYRLSTAVLDTQISRLSKKLFENFDFKGGISEGLLEAYQTAPIGFKLIGQINSDNSKETPNESELKSNSNGDKKFASDSNKRRDFEILEDPGLRNELIKELIAIKTAEQRADLGNDKAFFEKRAELKKKAKPKAVVDRKASKGRKIRYEIFEQLVNFMVVEPNNRVAEDRKEILDSIRGMSEGGKAQPVKERGGENNEKDIELF